MSFRYQACAPEGKRRECSPHRPASPEPSAHPSSPRAGCRSGSARQPRRGPRSRDRPETIRGPRDRSRDARGGHQRRPISGCHRSRRLPVEQLGSRASAAAGQGRPLAPAAPAGCHALDHLRPRRLPHAQGGRHAAGRCHGAAGTVRPRGGGLIGCPTARVRVLSPAQPEAGALCGSPVRAEARPA